MDGLEAVLFAEFDNVKGPKIKYQHPPNILSQEVEDSLSPYLLPGTDFSKDVVIFNEGDKLFIGFPQSIEGRKYCRNYFMFNLIFMLDKWDDVECYTNTLIKLSNIFEQLERENEFLLRQSPSARQPGVEPSKHLPPPSPDEPTIPHIIEQFYIQLRKSQKVVIPIDATNIITIKAISTRPEPPEVNLWDVPVPIQDLAKYCTGDMDAALIAIAAKIDGVRHVGHILHVLTMDTDIVVKGLRHLLYYNCITLVDIFQFGNRYAATPELAKLAPHTVDEAVKKEAVHYVTFQQAQRVPCDTFPMQQHDAETKTLTFEQIVLLYSKFHGQTVADFLTNERDKFGHTLDIRNFIIYGVVKGILRRVHEYPWLRREAVPKVENDYPTLAPFLDGKHCMDEICSQLWLPTAEVRAILANYKRDILMMQK
eukprot:TRINITY_DN68064_c7_g1_i1.p1 TRINITY_DN68064_c7_g1~~TRINITY_DN68064_c7_g1_i1.p1  ORF type:complete len:424 (-),score=48.60 TRINITY_DN68064_c7_g1_i1:38-1309(-)